MRRCGSCGPEPVGGIPSVPQAFARSHCIAKAELAFFCGMRPTLADPWPLADVGQTWPSSAGFAQILTKCGPASTTCGNFGQICAKFGPGSVVARLSGAGASATLFARIHLPKVCVRRVAGMPPVTRSGTPRALGGGDFARPAPRPAFGHHSFKLHTASGAPRSSADKADVLALAGEGERLAWASVPLLQQDVYEAIVKPQSV